MRKDNEISKEEEKEEEDFVDPNQLTIFDV